MLFTASWRSLWWEASKGPLPVQPVRISRGVPRFWPDAAGFAAIDELMPDGWMLGIHDAERFGRCYRRKLHALGVAAIQAALERAAGDDPRPLALCCFEACSNECHRGSQFGFGGWWERQTGERVPDLALLQGRGGKTALVCEVEPATTTTKEAA